MNVLKKSILLALITAVPTGLYAATDVNSDFIFSRNSISSVDLGNVLNSGSLDDTNLAGSGIKILDVKVNNNNFTGFKLSISNGGKMLLYNDSNVSVFNASAPGTFLPYTLTMFDSTGTLGTALPTLPSNFTATPSATEVSFSSSVTQATVDKYFDIRVKANSSDLSKLLTRANYKYKDNLRITISDL